MKYNYDLTVVVPGIRNEHWETLVDHMKHACKRYSYEMIFSGPCQLPESIRKDEKIKFIKNFGSPTRALHLGLLLAESPIFTWLSDDAHLYEGSIDACIDLLNANNPKKDIVCVRYTEGFQHSGAEFPPEYWVAGTHPDLRAPGVDQAWKIPLVMMISTEYYRELGGLDHRFHHLNMNVIDLGFRAQRNGSKVLLSPTQVMNCDFELNRTVESHPVINAFWNNDRPLFWELYKEKDIRPIKIEENWRDSSPVWELRKFK